MTPDIDPESFLSMSKSMFSQMVEKLATEENMPYLDAVNEMCVQLEIPHESVGPYISKPLMEKLLVEASKLNLLNEKSGIEFHGELNFE
jgi:hypothetical protein